MPKKELAMSRCQGKGCQCQVDKDRLAVLLDKDRLAVLLDKGRLTVLLDKDRLAVSDG